MFEMQLRVHAPLRSALKSARARYGIETLELTDEFVAEVPEDLRDELANWVEALNDSLSGQGPSEGVALKLDSPELTPENIARALRREITTRREAEVQRWLALHGADDWLIEVDGFPDDSFELHPDIAKLRDDERIAARLPYVEKRRQERNAEIQEFVTNCSLARLGLTDYAKSIPEYARAAKEDYDVRSVALDHYVKAVAGVSPDSLVLVKASDHFKKAKFEERTAPSLRAFEVLDRVTKAISELPTPEGVDVSVGRLHRYRRAVADKGRWLQDEPVTVVMVTVTPYCLGDKIVLFFADSQEKKRFFSDVADEPVDEISP